MNILVKELNISFTQAGSLMGAFSLPGMIFALPGGMLADKFGSKRVGTISLLIFSLGTFGVSFSDSYLRFAFGRFITGVGAAMILVIAPLVVTSWFYDKKIGLAMSIFNISVPLGTILSLNVIGAMATQFGWRISIWCTFFATLSASLLFFILYRDREHSSSPLKKETPSQESGNSKKWGWAFGW